VRYFTRLVLLPALLVLASSPMAGKDRDPDLVRAHADQVGHAQALLDSGEVSAAEAAFRDVLEQSPKFAPAHVGLGQAALARGDLVAAEQAFRQALRAQKRFAPAFRGLGLVYGQKDKQLRRAISYFKDALRADKGYVEAQFDLAQMLQRYGSSETLKAYQKVIEISATHVDAHFQIGRIHEVDGDLARAEAAYRDQIGVRPDHYGARLHLGRALVATGKISEAGEMLESVVNQPSEFQRRAVLALAGLYQRTREYGRAETVFDRYIATLEPDEQSLYHDVGLVTAGEGTEDFRSLPIGEQRARAQAFWARLDPAPATEANERLVEHYRRVATAREHLGAHRHPWDDRGEAYIRFGEPDHVSRSGNIVLETDPRVVAVKERLIARAGEAGAALAQERGAMAFASSNAIRREARASQRSYEDGGQPSKAQLAQSAILGWPVYPVAGIWEYWIYTGVGDGVELTFVQKNVPGPYEYADMPLGTGRAAGIWQRMHPKVVMDREVHRKPATYRPNFATGPLDFSYYTAGFKAEGGQTALEVYYGIPTRGLTFRPDPEGERADLSLGVAVYDAEGEPVSRSSHDMALRSAGAVDTSAGSFVPEMDRILLPPGDYQLAIQVVDRSSGRTQVYRQNRSIKDYGEKALAISDIELAARVSLVPDARPEAGRRFIKGEVEVVPMASRAFRPDQPMYIYYEIYNLARDEFGATRYRISYEVKSLERKPVAARVLGGLGRLLGRNDESGIIRIEYEQLGDRPDETAYLELDMTASEPGAQLLKIEVTDIVSGQTSRAATTFSIR
jgi:GWxTD domain-containing protein